MGEWQSWFKGLLSTARKNMCFNYSNLDISLFNSNLDTNILPFKISIWSKFNLNHFDVYVSLSITQTRVLYLSVLTKKRYTYPKKQRALRLVKEHKEARVCIFRTYLFGQIVSLFLFVSNWDSVKFTTSQIGLRQI